MTGKQTGVMWMGLLLIALRMFTDGQFNAIWTDILSGSSNDGLIGVQGTRPKSWGPGTSTNNSAGGGGGSVGTTMLGGRSQI